MSARDDPLGGIGAEARWVGWDDEGGRKVPKSASGNARSNDPSTWMTRDEAEALARERGYSGVGVMLSDGLTGIDLDGCVHGGALDPWAREIVGRIGSYAELSPSGTGVHILCYADPVAVGSVGRADHGRGIEVYNHGRYFTVTGNRVNGAGVEDRTGELGGFVAERFPGESGEDRIARGAGRLARDQVARRANETVIHNVGRDRERGARFARVPMGGETCGFCIMLASRGFVYHTEETAGEFDHFHSSCRCKVVPGFPTMERYVKNGVRVSRGLDPSVEGYDPDAYLKEWRLLESLDRAVGSGAISSNRRIRRRVETLGRRIANARAGAGTAALEAERDAQSDLLERAGYENAREMRRLMRKHRELWSGTSGDLGGMIEDGVPESVKSTVVEGLSYLPKDWVEKIAARGVTVRAGGGFYGRSCYRSGRIELAAEGADALQVAHEAVHAMDDIDPEFRRRSAEFFKRRTSGKKIKPLRELTGNENYKLNELAYEVEDAYNPYAYKKYNETGSYEVSTMGIQDVYLDPKGLHEADPELFNYAVALLLCG